ncbi:MAG: FAD-binding oxidoreductase [Alistipes sp.]|nr:FAD-binding oxidoreductase [Alistipes sp.]
MTEKYRRFLHAVRAFIPCERVYTDYLRRLAWGTDAGFYRLVPQIVVRAAGEEEVVRLMRTAAGLGVPLTFRAAGTSLSGQAVSDSVLVVAGKHWERCEVLDGGRAVRLQPGVVGARVNEVLKPYGYRFPPDPASIRSAMVGGIVMNNASGMNCGTHANSDRMLLSARLVLADGTLLDTGDKASRRAFSASHGEFLRTVEALRDRVRGDKALTERIRHKYSIKNVMGLNLLPLVQSDDPFEIIAHLLVGSEGTLAFLAGVTMRTEREYAHKASAMVYFGDIGEASRAVVEMRKLQDAAGERIVHSAEMLDRKSLASVGDTAGEGLTAVLTETKAHTPEELAANVARIEELLGRFELHVPARFTDDPAEQAKYWAVRSGIFPAVGGSRPAGTTCLIEDVAFHIEDLPRATAELQALIARHGYDDACIYGHALEGNYHFIINQSFSTPAEAARYEALMDDVVELVVGKYDGSLKAEHGTGRNMAPFLRREWGDDAYAVMRAVKELFDPAGLLNPGVIFNDDPRCHLSHFKPLPLTDPLIDRCIECGFCEVNCLTCGLTLSSRQRIVVRREIARLKASGEDPRLVRELERGYRYPGEQTCAGDGLCSTSCPVGINTGDLTHALRALRVPPGSAGHAAGEFAARRFAGLKNTLRPVLTLADTAHRVLGTRTMTAAAKGLHALGLPRWLPSMPRAYRLPESLLKTSVPEPDKVVYFPSCINQTMGLARETPVAEPLPGKMVSLLRKAGYEVIFPGNMERLCCGTIWESKGMADIADRKTAELEEALWRASEAGRWPVLCDQSPCLHRMREKIGRMKLYEPAEFIWTFLRDRLEFHARPEPVAVHVTCSMRRMGLAGVIVSLARLCAAEVVVPEEVGCCGFAGDRGFTHPEVNAWALRKLRPVIERSGVKVGYSNSRTCEIGLSARSGVPYVSIVYLVDACTTPKETPGA